MGRPHDAPGAPDPLGFEEALARLEGVVAELEDGELDLEAALRAFEEGVKLTRHCAEQLSAARQRVDVLMREGSGYTTRPFAGTDEDEAEDAG